MRARPTYNDADVRRFVALARGGRDSRRERHAAMRRHPAGTALDTGTRVLTGPAPIPRDWPELHNPEPVTTRPWPTLTAADGTHELPLPASDPSEPGDR